MKNLQDVLGLLNGVGRLNGNEYKAKCPCHDDRKASLNIKQTGDKILMHCKAGCETLQVIEALGLTWSDLGSQSAKNTYKDKIEYLYSKQYGSVSMTAEYPYYNEKGEYLYSKVRLEGGAIDGKEIRYLVIDKANDTFRTCKGDYDRNTKPLYRLKNLLDSAKNGYKKAFIVEGEKDCETLAKLGGEFSNVVTMGGAGDWRKEFAKYFKGYYVTVLADNDEAGQNVARQIVNDLKNYAFAVKVVKTSVLQHGDVTDYLTIERGTKESLKVLIDNADYEASNYVIPTDKGKFNVNAGLLAELINKQEQLLIVRNGERDNVYYYQNGYYRLLNKSELKSIIADYIPQDKISDNQLNSICNLIVMNSRNEIARDRLNADQEHINLANGLYNIKTNKLEEHSAEHIFTKQLNIKYNPNAKAPVFTKYIKEFASNDEGILNKEKLDVLQEYCGLLISNLRVYDIKKSLILVSEQGNTGKSVFIRTLENLLGANENVIAISLMELVPENRFVLGMLDEARLIVCGDESNTDIKDSSLFKKITGGDLVKIEKKGQQAQYSHFNGGIVIACNGLPCFTDDKGEHLFKRMLIVPCEHHINDTNIDVNLTKKIENELEGVLNWCLEGLKRLINNDYKFTECEEIQAMNDEYRKRIDTLFHFIDENYDITNDSRDVVSKTELETRYRMWAEQEGYENIVRPRNIKNRLNAIGIRMDKGKCNGDNIYRYKGIRLKDKTGYIPFD